MRRAGQKRIVSRPTTFVTPPENDAARGSLVAELDRCDVSISRVDRIAADPETSSHGAFVTDGSSGPDDRGARRRQLPVVIRKRIESRLAGRVRNLAVRIVGDTVVLEGQCATFYTKQLAQHAALGILDDEHLENAIAVDVPR
jgi:hypothetical protein